MSLYHDIGAEREKFIKAKMQKPKGYHGELAFMPSYDECCPTRLIIGHHTFHQLARDSKMNTADFGDLMKAAPTFMNMKIIRTPDIADWEIL